MELQTIYNIFLSCGARVTTDSRDCPVGSLFVALQGNTFNGNCYARIALENGCAYAVVDQEEYVVKNDNRYILVENGLRLLQQLANYHRRKLGIPIIAITGTNGKTTTKELTAAVLSKKYNVLYTQGNLNNQIGVPLTLLHLTPTCQMAVVEMGASHPGDIKELVEIAEPDYGIITNVGKAHLMGFGSFEGVIQTKGELYEFLRKGKNSLVFVDQDNPYLVSLSNGLNTIGYGTGGKTFIRGKITANNPYLAFQWGKSETSVTFNVTTRLIGQYNLSNLLAAIAIGMYFEVSPLLINDALSCYTPTNNRSQWKKTNFNELIIDAYNANPTSMGAALRNFYNLEATPKMVILGDMLELGDASQAEHQAVVDYLNNINLDQVWLVGSEFGNVTRITDKRYRFFANVEEVMANLQNNKPRGYTILIKGSNGMRLDKLVGYL